MHTQNLRILCNVLRVDLVYEAEGGTLTPFFDSLTDSPLMLAPELREKIKNGIKDQDDPYLMDAGFYCFFAGIRSDGGFVYMGPMCLEQMSSSSRRQMYRNYGIDEAAARHLPRYTLPQIRDMVLLTNTVLGNVRPENADLLETNHIVLHMGKEEGSDKISFRLKEEERDDEAAYRHSYQEEQLLMQAVKEGKPQEAVRLAENMDKDEGILGVSGLTHQRNLSIIGISLCTRAAISGGLPPREAYRVSGYYIQKCDAARNPSLLLQYRNRAIEDLASRVLSLSGRTRSSAHVEKCKDYISRHYREKIYLEDIAAALGISPSYLSRLFRKETGICLQDYVTRIRVDRAENLLVFSDYSLSDIAHYVNFPSQSYFGKAFRQLKGMSPKAWRDRYKTAEFME